MKYVQINAYSGGWADSVIFKKHRELIEQGDDSYVFWGVGLPTQNSHEKRLVSNREYYIDKILTRLDGKIAFHSKRPTRRFLNELDSINPDVVHLHSLIGNFINVKMLFEWLADHDCQVIWTQHDCWAFTGFCLYFSALNCNQWLSCCKGSCPFPPPEKYPTLGLRSRIEWSYRNKQYFFNLLPSNRMTLYCPSEWMAGLLKQSYLSKYPVKVVHNCVDASFFRPVASNLRNNLGLSNKFVILGVANLFSERKGFSDFIRLANDLDDRFAVVLIGLTSAQKKIVTENEKLPIIGIEGTLSKEDLVKYYSMADVFFNPSKEDNYPTTCLEAQACGTPVVTYDVGGCIETLSLEASVATSGYEQSLSVIKSMACV